MVGKYVFKECGIWQDTIMILKAIISLEKREKVVEKCSKNILGTQ